MGLSHSLKSDNDRLMKDNRGRYSVVHAVITLTIHYDQQMHAAIIQYISQQSLESRAIKGKEREGWLSVGVVAQWQSAGGLSQRSWVQSPAAPPFFLSLCCFKGLWTVTAPIVFH